MMVTATTTEKFYTGLSITLPAHSYFSLTGCGVFSVKPCKWIGFSLTSADHLDTCYYNAEAGMYHAAASISLYTGDAPRTVYVWGQWDSPSTNNVMLSGFYVTDIKQP